MKKQTLFFTLIFLALFGNAHAITIRESPAKIPATPATSEPAATSSSQNWELYKNALRSQNLSYRISFPKISGQELLYVKYLLDRRDIGIDTACPMGVNLTAAEYSKADKKIANDTGAIFFILAWNSPSTDKCIENIEAFLSPLLKQEKRGILELKLMTLPDNSPKN